MSLVAEAAQSVPWWGSGVFTLAGGLVVATLGRFFNAYNNQRKAKADRLDTEQAMRRQAVVDLLTTAHQDLDSAAEDGKIKAAQFYSSFIQSRLVLEGELREKA